MLAALPRSSCLGLHSLLSVARTSADLRFLLSPLPFPFLSASLPLPLLRSLEDESHRVPDVSIVESSAELLYGLIHQRFIITRQGLQQMVRPSLFITLSARELISQLQYAKFDSAHFGHCPRVYCTQTKLLPCGRSDLPGVDTVKLYCPSCVDMYVPPSSRFQGVDGKLRVPLVFAAHFKPLR